MVETTYIPTLWDVSRGLEMLSDACRDYREYSDRQKAVISTLVAQLRANGATWQDIADAAGVTVQAAHKRWRNAPFPVPPPEGFYLDDEDDGGWS